MSLAEKTSVSLVLNAAVLVDASLTDKTSASVGVSEKTTVSVEIEICDD